MPDFNNKPFSGAVIVRVILLAAALANTVFSQDFIVDRIDETANTVVYSIVQDREGFIWYGGELGLARHNGYQLNFFQHDPYKNSLSNNDVGCLHIDPDGILWAATWGGGVNRFNPRTGEFSYLRHQPQQSNSLSDNRVQNIYQDRSGQLWFGTYTGGLNRYDPVSGEFTRYYHQPSNLNSLSHNRIWCITEDSSGALWIATDRGLDRLDKNRRFFTHYHHDVKNPASISSDQTQWLYIDHDHVLWIATKNGLNRYRPENNSFDRFYHQLDNPNSLSSNLTYSILEDRYGFLWVGTNDAGLNRMNKSNGSVIRLMHDPRNTNSISNNDIRSIYEDRAGVLWIGTRGGGINTIDLKPKKFNHVFKNIEHPGGISHNTITSFAMDENNYLWIGTDGGGVNVYHPQTKRCTIIDNTPGRRSSITGNRIRAMLTDRTGDIWIGTYGGGLNRYRAPNGVINIYSQNGREQAKLNSDRIHALMEDNTGMIWIGTDEGLNRLNPKTGELKAYINHPADTNSLSHNSVLCIFQAKNGKLWIGTWGGGINRFDPVSEKFNRYAHEPGNPNSLSNNEVFCIYEDRNGRMWIGTRGGLNRLDRTTFTFRHYTAEHGLPINEIWGILEDASQNLWISTTNGLSRFQPASETFRNYDTDDGLQGRQFRQGAYFQSKDGRMFFGGLNGFNWFYPDSIHDNTYIPPIVINHFKVFDRPRTILPAEFSDGRIILHHDQNFFSFEFASLDYTNPKKNQYAYKLEGFDSRWVYSGPRNYASYTNLDPGDYTFTVRGTNSDGLWNEEGISLNIHITPPFWMRIWFKIFAGLLLGGIVFMIFHLRMRSVKAYQRLLESQVSDRTVELRNSRNELENKKNQLEKINLIVQTINTEIHLDELLKALIRETELIRAAIHASAYVCQDDKEGYIFAATTEEEEAGGLGRSFRSDEISRKFIDNAVELFPDLFAVKSAAYTETNKIYHTAVFRIRVHQHVEGFLVFRSADPSGIKFYELSLLNDLQEHIISAFIKAKLLFDQKRVNDELKKLNNTKNEFLGIAAHDLRNPLTAIIGYIEMILEDMNAGNIQPELIRKDLQTVFRSAQQMVHLITALLDISAIESGKISLDLQQNDINAVFEECEKLHRKTAQHKNIELVVEKNPGLPKAVFDKSRITEVVDNLLGNAIKYTQSGGKVHVFSRLNERNMEVYVQDTGLGLTEEDLNDLFSGLKRPSNKPTGGETSTGLGLVIVKKIIDVHGGEIRVISRKNEGSTFIFSLLVPDNLRDT